METQNNRTILKEPGHSPSKGIHSAICFQNGAPISSCGAKSPAAESWSPLPFVGIFNEMVSVWISILFYFQIFGTRYYKTHLAKSLTPSCCAGKGWQLLRAVPHCAELTSGRRCRSGAGRGCWVFGTVEIFGPSKGMADVFPIGNDLNGQNSFKFNVPPWNGCWDRSAPEEKDNTLLSFQPGRNAVDPSISKLWGFDLHFPNFGDLICIFQNLGEN